jgi:uncharacterized membrane protein YbhN (UPF0104 family)
MFQKSKIKFWLSLAKVVFFAWIIYFFYKQINRLSWKEVNELEIASWVSFCLTIVLVLLNFGFEYIKWLFVIKEAKIKLPRKTIIDSFMSGNLTGFFTPSNLGNFIGRLFYVDRKFRIQVVLLTMFTNASQFLSSILFGAISILLIGLQVEIPYISLVDLNLFLYVGIVLAVIGYYCSYIVLKWLFKRKSYIAYFDKYSPVTFQFLTKNALISILRYIVYSSQFLILLHAFGVESSWKLYAQICQVYFLTTFMPSLWMGKLMIRESIAVWVLSPFIENELVILVTSLTLWVINNGIPALISVPYFKLKTKL